MLPGRLSWLAPPDLTGPAVDPTTGSAGRRRCVWVRRYGPVVAPECVTCDFAAVAWRRGGWPIGNGSRSVTLQR
jgi:hypothetical protein